MALLIGLVTRHARAARLEARCKYGWKRFEARPGGCRRRMGLDLSAKRNRARPHAACGRGRGLHIDSNSEVLRTENQPKPRVVESAPLQISLGILRRSRNTACLVNIHLRRIHIDGRAWRPWQVTSLIINVAECISGIIRHIICHCL